MKSLTQWIERNAATVAVAIGPAGAEAANSKQRPWVKRLTARAPKIAIGVLFIGAIGWINLATVKGLNFEFLYLFGCVLVGWATGVRPALGCAVLSGIFLCVAELRSPATSPWIFFCNSVVRLAAFAAIGWLAAKVASLTRDLEQRVAQRTVRLKSEVNEHQETAELLNESIQLFKQVTENIADVFWVTDTAKTQVHYVSPEFEKVWGESRQSLYVSPSTWLEGIHQEDRERVTRAMLTKQARGEYDEEYRVVRPDGSLRWVHDRAFPVRDEKGMIYRLVGIAEDITERKRAESLLRAQRDVGIALSFTNDLDYALERLLGVAVQFEGIECGGIYLMDQDTGELHLRAHRGLSGSFVRRIQHYRADATETRLARAGHIVYVRHDQIPRSLEVLWGSEGLRALAIVPIQHKGVVVGMLNLGSYRQDEIPPKIRLGIEMIASQFAGAIARIRAEDMLRRSERQILEISDREQAHIGQDIHDGLCQQLVGIAFDANALEESLNAAAPDQARLARRIAMMLDEAISESRRVARGLYPVRLETEGLVPALKDLANRTSERFKIRCFCETAAPEFVCDATTGTHLYRIAQEAVNNALKHSGAGRVSIQLAEQNGQIELRVGDDGKGIEPGRPRTAGMGLYIMDYRARSMGGALRVHPGPDGGTVVTCTVPRKTL